MAKSCILQRPNKELCYKAVLTHWFGGLGNADKGFCGISDLSGSGRLRDIDVSRVAGGGHEKCVCQADIPQKRNVNKRNGTQQK